MTINSSLVMQECCSLVSRALFLRGYDSSCHYFVVIVEGQDKKKINFVPMVQHLRNLEKGKH